MGGEGRRVNESRRELLVGGGVKGEGNGEEEGSKRAKQKQILLENA